MAKSIKCYAQCLDIATMTRMQEKQQYKLTCDLRKTMNYLLQVRNLFMLWLTLQN